MVVLPLLGFPAKATVSFLIIVRTDHNLMSHPPAQHHSGALDANHEWPGMVVADDRDFDTGHEAHRDKPAVQAASGFNRGQSDFFARPNRGQGLDVFVVYSLLPHVPVSFISDSCFRRIAGTAPPSHSRFGYYGSQIR